MSNPANRRKTVCVREYAWLCTYSVNASLDCAQVSESAFDHLCELGRRFSKNGMPLVVIESKRRLKLDNFVGVIETPCGTIIEIIPKHQSAHGDLQGGRALLKKLLAAFLGLPSRKVGTASLQIFDAPLSEWVIAEFLHELDTLISKGLRFQYHQMEEELPFLRGQLNISAQLRQPPGRSHRFQVRHESLLCDRPENRLLKLSLDRIRLCTRDADNWRLAQELSVRLHEIPASKDIKLDLIKWDTGRLLAHYQPIKPLCELILNQHMPLAISGEFRGISLLFPMEKLFENYVTQWFKCNLSVESIFSAQKKNKSLCKHQDRNFFSLRPDIYIENGSQRWVLDTKWKLLDAKHQKKDYDIKQSDFYQLYAYGQKYLMGSGRMALIYPLTPHFDEPLEPFHFDGDLTLEVLPFDLESEILIGLERLELPSSSKPFFS